MMSFHLSILITPTENRDIKRWGLEEESDTERVCERQKERENHGNSSKQGLSALHPKCG